ncbi:unnamed protein product [Darwinula stevensoni]|uniref:Uncharacterized protein n=1 Tax=Darwinula stevensoni TaxID=69355 RepID=A0A7R9A791_9CRUS|nr:unnamed protein product [Darwinula stevensoni]CAG0892201.1 unnamed protein product [Darwinula stevensoni]
MIAKKIEETEPGCIGKKLYHLRVLASPYITAQDFLENIKKVESSTDLKKLGEKLEKVSQIRRLTASFMKLAGVSEDELETYSSHLTEHALEPYLKMKNAEKNLEWKSYVQRCTNGEINETMRKAPDYEVKMILGNVFRLPDGVFKEPFCAAAFSIKSFDEAKECMLGLQEHQTLHKAPREIPIAFITEEIVVAAAIQGALVGPQSRTGVVIVNAAPRKGSLFTQRHSYAVICSGSRIQGLASSILTVRDVLTSLKAKDGWMLSNVRLRSWELPSTSKIASLVNLEFEDRTRGRTSGIPSESNTAQDLIESPDSMSPERIEALHTIESDTH